MTDKKGMTLTEIMAIIIITSIIITFSIAGFLRQGRSFEMSAEINELVKDLNYAKQMSITEQENYGIRFYFHENRYDVLRYSDDFIVKTKTISSDLELISVDNYSEVKFTLFGAVFRRGEVIIEGEGLSKIIEIKPSGFIYVQGNDSN